MSSKNKLSKANNVKLLRNSRKKKTHFKHLKFSELFEKKNKYDFENSFETSDMQKDKTNSLPSFSFHIQFWFHMFKSFEHLSHFD